MPEGSDEGVIRAAGAVVWRPGPLGPQVALVHRPRYDDWSYPKGKCHRLEHVLAAAIREVAEETGLAVVLGRPLTASVYQVGDRSKRVSYWTARCARSAGFEPNDEVDEVRWLRADLAMAALTYPRDVTLLEEFRSRPARTVPLIVLRHASAGRKATGGRARSSDLARPLDERGTADAAALAGLLAAFGPCRVVSSAAERCVATVRPYALAAGVAIEVEPAFTVPSAAMTDGELLTAGVGDAAMANGKKSRAAPARPAAAQPVPAQRAPDQARARAASLAGSGVPTLICAHRENLPAIIGAALGKLGAGQASAGQASAGQASAGQAGAQADDEPLRKGAFLVLQSAGGVLISAERHELGELGPRSASRTGRRAGPRSEQSHSQTVGRAR